MSVKLALFAGLFCGPLLVGGQGLDGAVALLQGAVRVNDEEDASPLTAKRYLVDNSVLGHRGPGLLWRSTKDMNGTVGADQYVAWGTTVEGFDDGDGWVKVNDLYLPMHIRGATVLKRNEEPGERKKLRISYRPTSVRAQDGSWIPCQIVRLGSKPDTFDLVVNPRDFASYEMSDVPASMLRKVQRVRQFISVPAAPAGKSEVKEVKPEPVTPDPQDVEGFMQLRVGDLDGKMMDLQVLKRSPLRTTMKMACAHTQTPWQHCLSKVRFLHKGKQLNETQHPYELGWRDGETIHMQRA